MVFRYFAYGSNLWMPRMRVRCPSARLIGVADLPELYAVYDKPAADGSAKLNIRPAPGSSVPGVVYEIDESNRARLDAAEPAYTPIQTTHGLAYAYEGEPTDALPADWYVAIVEAGARSHGLEPPAWARTLPASQTDPVAACCVGRRSADVLWEHDALGPGTPNGRCIRDCPEQLAAVDALG